METLYFTSISKQRHIRHTDDYFDPIKVPEGYTAKRTVESGIRDLLRSPTPLESNS